MSKKIPGNFELKISLDGKLEYLDGSACTLPVENGFCWISMYGESRRVLLKWLGLIAHFEVELPASAQGEIWNISFVKKDLRVSRTPSRRVMVFGKPITVADSYRVIPGFSRYAISCTGEILDLRLWQKVKYSIRQGEYSQVSLYDADRSRIAGVYVHRLVALAWVTNSSYLKRPIVNHIDGIKHNCHASNLEWVSYAENANHAFATGLRLDNQTCRVRDALSEVIHSFHSIRSACEFMGENPDLKYRQLMFRNKGKLINGRYEIRRHDDQTPWFYEKLAGPVKTGRYTLHVTYPDGRKEDWHDVRTFIKAFKIWNVGGNVLNMIEKAKVLNPGMQIDVSDHYQTGAVQSYEIATGEIIEAPSLRGMSELTGEHYGLIRDAVNRGQTWRINGRAYRNKCDTPWDTNFTIYAFKPKCILATHHDTKETKRLNSLRDAAAHFNVDRSVIKRLLKTGAHFRLWKLIEIES